MVAYERSRAWRVSRLTAPRRQLTAECAQLEQTHRELLANVAELDSELVAEQQELARLQAKQAAIAAAAAAAAADTNTDAAAAAESTTAVEAVMAQ